MESLNQNMDLELELELSASLQNYPKETQDSVRKYLQQLNDKEKKAYKIAKDHLGTSFHIVRSVGYNDWILAQQSSS